MRRAAVLVLAVGMFFLAGCGGDDDEAESDDSGSDDAGADVSDDTGDDDSDSDGAGSGGATDVGNFGIPAPDGGTVILELGDTGRSIDYPVGDFDRVVQFYEDWVAEQPYPFRVIDEPDTRGYTSDPLETEVRQSVTILRVNDVTNVILGDE